MGSIPGSGRSPGKGYDNPLQYSCLENPMDRGAWWAKVHRVTENRTRLKHHSMKCTTMHTPALASLHWLFPVLEILFSGIHMANSIISFKLCSNISISLSPNPTTLHYLNSFSLSCVTTHYMLYVIHFGYTHHFFSLSFLNYESIITYLYETWKIQKKGTYSSTIQYNYFSR